MTKRAGQTRCAATLQQHLALGERLGDQAELVLLEVAQAAVDQLGGRRRGRAGEIAALDQQHRQAAAGGVARDAGAVDAAADDQQVVLAVHISRRAGKRTLSATPSPAGRSAAAMLPPWNSAIRRATYRPSPRCGAPVGARFAHRDHRIEQRPRIASGSSGPLFATVSSASPPASSSETRTGSPAARNRPHSPPACRGAARPDRASPRPPCAARGTLSAKAACG